MADIEKQAVEIAEKTFKHYDPKFSAMSAKDLWRAYIIGVFDATVNSATYGDEYSLNRLKAAIESEKHFDRLVKENAQ